MRKYILADNRIYIKILVFKRHEMQVNLPDCYLKMVRLWQPGPWKQTPRHRRNGSSQSLCAIQSRVSICRMKWKNARRTSSDWARATHDADSRDPHRYQTPRRPPWKCACYFRNSCHSSRLGCLVDIQRLTLSSAAVSKAARQQRVKSAGVHYFCRPNGVLFFPERPVRHVYWRPLLNTRCT